MLTFALPLLLLMPYYAKIISVFLLATVKFFYTPIYAYLIGMDQMDAVITMIAGGVISFIFFYYISYFIIISTKYVKPVAIKFAPGNLKVKYHSWLEKRQVKKQNRMTFTRRNRLMVRLRMIGMWAIIFTTPFFLSIPVGAFLLRKYYEHRRGVVWFAVAAIAIEGFVFSWLIWHVPTLRP